MRLDASSRLMTGHDALDALNQLLDVASGAGNAPLSVMCVSRDDRTDVAGKDLGATGTLLNPVGWVPTLRRHSKAGCQR